MMKTRRVLAILLALMLTLGSVTAFAAGPFSDVAEDAYNADAVAWAAEQKITEGRGGGIFDPDATVTRAEAVTFLWRMAGSPDPTGTETFTDVEADANRGWYQTAVRWAVEQGITDGTGNGEFSPYVTCSRGMILTMLYRLEGCPYDAALAAEVPEDSTAWTMEDFGNSLIRAFVDGLRSENVLADVEQGQYYELPVYWAMMNQILSENHVDTEARTVLPAAPCPRGEMAFFLYRADIYEKAVAAAEEANKPLPPIETGTIPETVVLDKDGVKITATGMEYDGFNDVWLKLTVENGTAQQVSPDVSELFVNTFYTSPSVFIPVQEGNMTIYDSVIAAPGERNDFYVGLNDLREKGIAEVCEIELRMAAYAVTQTEDGEAYEPVAEGDAVTLRTSLYDAARSYDPEGTTVYDKDGLKVLVTKAENDPYMGPQLSIFVYNGSDRETALELKELQLDGETVTAFFDLDVPAGKRGCREVYIESDETLPIAKEAVITLQTLDTENYEPDQVFEPVTVQFAE